MLIIISLILFLCFINAVAEDNFSKEKAFAHVKYLADTIGPRPMGSPKEKEALLYTAEKLAEYGCQVEWQMISQSDRVNTSSGNVIGRFPGLTSREIVIGAHIDSAGPEIPGANDDGSGIAVMLEAARVLCKQPHQSTLVFVAFGGEESGLVGSSYFVEHYPLENVALMLQLDMASDDSPLTIWVDTKQHQTPEWLVSASIDTFHSLGYRNIDYATHFQSFNNALGGASSDHEPFMKKGIPAIAFVSDVTAPIHTRNDSVENFKIDGLERSGKLILELVKKFDKGQPKENKSHYMLFMLLERPLYINPGFIIGLIILSIAIAIAVLIVVRKRRDGFAEDKKIRLSWPKLALLLFIMIIMMFASEWLIQLIKGERFSWFAHPGPHLLYAIPFVFLGIWLALQILWKWRLRKDVFFYLIRSTIYFAVLIIGFWLLGGPRLALYPASGLLLIGIGCLIPWGWLKGLLWIISPYMMLRLFIPDYYEFVYRSLAAGAFGAARDTWIIAAVSAGLILSIALFSMPFLLGFAAVYRSYSGDLFWLKRFRKKVALIPIGILIIAGAIYLFILPSYTRIWEQSVSVNQKLDEEKNRTFIEFASSDYLKNIEANINGKIEKMNMWACTKEIDYPLDMNWLKVGYLCQPVDEEKDKLVNLNMMLEFEKLPYTVSIRLESNSAFAVEQCNVKYNQRKDNSATILWYSFPQGTLQPELKLRMPKDATLSAEVLARFLETPVSISCKGENKDFIHRAVITKKIDLLK
jgi:putative aminopeptidase FrvX